MVHFKCPRPENPPKKSSPENFECPVIDDTRLLALESSHTHSICSRARTPEEDLGSGILENFLNQRNKGWGYVRILALSWRSQILHQKQQQQQQQQQQQSQRETETETEIKITKQQN